MNVNLFGVRGDRYAFVYTIQLEIDHTAKTVSYALTLFVTIMKPALNFFFGQATPSL